VKTSVVDVSRRRRSVSTAVKSTQMSEAMPRQVLTAQLIVDKHHAMVLANVTFKFTCHYMASSREHVEGQVYA